MHKNVPCFIIDVADRQIGNQSACLHYGSTSLPWMMRPRQEKHGVADGLTYTHRVLLVGVGCYNLEIELHAKTPYLILLDPFRCMGLGRALFLG